MPCHFVPRFFAIQQEIIDHQSKLPEQAQSHVEPQHVPMIAALLTLAEAVEDAGGDVAETLSEFGQDDTPDLPRANEEEEEEEDGDELEHAPPVLSGRQPVSLLQELCQARALSTPSYVVEREGGDDHVPKFSCAVTVDVDKEQMTVAVTGFSSKGEARKAAARKMLIEHFDAREKHGGRPS